MALDRPAQPPEKPSPEDHPAPDTPTDPWGVDRLTRAQAFESLRAQAAAQDSSPPLADQPRDYWSELPRLSEAAGTVKRSV